jgi:hypothetical protein
MPVADAVWGTGGAGGVPHLTTPAGEALAAAKMSATVDGTVEA